MKHTKANAQTNVPAFTDGHFIISEKRNKIKKNKIKMLVNINNNWISITICNVIINKLNPLSYKA